MNIKTTLTGIFCLSLLIMLALALVLCWPFAVLWSINTLFGTSISYTFLNWLATAVLLFTLVSAGVNRK